MAIDKLGNPSPGRSNKLEMEVRRRAAKAKGVSVRRVFLSWYGGPDEKPPLPGNLWNVSIGLNNGPGTDTIEDTWAYGNYSYEVGLRHFLARRDIWHADEMIEETRKTQPASFYRTGRDNP